MVRVKQAAAGYDKFCTDGCYGRSHRMAIIWVGMLTIVVTCYCCFRQGLQVVVMWPHTES